MQANSTPDPALARRINWIDVWLTGYLGVVVAVYASGSRISTWLSNHLGTMPVRGGLWTWAWSIDRVGDTQAVRIIGATLIGGAAALVLSRVLPWASLRRYRAGLWVVLTVGAGLVFWYERVLVSLGDALAYLSMARGHVWFKLSQPLSTALFAASYTVLGRLGWPVAPSLSLVSCLAGCLWVIVLGLLAEQLPPWPARLLLAGGLMAGGVALFFGYLETTIVAMAVGGLYLYFSYRAIQGHSLIPAGLALGLTLALHGQMLYLLPSFVIVAWIAYRQGARRSIALSSLLVVLPAALIVAFALTHPALSIAGYGDALGGGDNRMFVPLFKVELPTEYYTLFSFNDWTELLNLGLRATPLLGVLLAPAAAGLWKRRREPAAWFWAAVVGGALTFVVLWNPDLGMAHDWDLYTPALMLSVIACVCLWPMEWTPRAQTVWTGMALGFSAAALSVVVSYFSPAGTWDLWANTARPQHPLTARFGGEIDLLGFNNLAPSYAAGQSVSVQLLWRPRQPLASDYTAGVYLIDDSAKGQRLLAQDDHRPMAFIDRYSSEWETGEVITDQHALLIPTGTPSGEYELWAVLYDLNTMARLPVGPEDGPDHLVLANVSVK